MKYHDPEPNVPLYLNRHHFPKPAEWVPHVEGWEPLYLRDFGDACRVCLEDGSRMYLGMGSPSLYRQVAAYHGIDVSQMRKHYIYATGRSQSMPLAVPSRQLVLFAYKARCPETKNDSAYGYVADTKIQRVEAIHHPHERLRITLKSGNVLHAPVSESNFYTLRQTAGFFLYYLHVNKIMPL